MRSHAGRSVADDGTVGSGSTVMACRSVLELERSLEMVEVGERPASLGSELMRMVVVFLVWVHHLDPKLVLRRNAEPRRRSQAKVCQSNAQPKSNN